MRCGRAGCFAPAALTRPIPFLGLRPQTPLRAERARPRTPDGLRVPGLGLKDAALGWVGKGPGWTAVHGTHSVNWFPLGKSSATSPPPRRDDDPEKLGSAAAGGASELSDLSYSLRRGISAQSGRAASLLHLLATEGRSAVCCSRCWRCWSSGSSASGGGGGNNGDGRRQRQGSRCARSPRARPVRGPRSVNTRAAATSRAARTRRRLGATAAGGSGGGTGGSGHRRRQRFGDRRQERRRRRGCRRRRQRRRRRRRHGSRPVPTLPNCTPGRVKLTSAQRAEHLRARGEAHVPARRQELLGQRPARSDFGPKAAVVTVTRRAATTRSGPRRTARKDGRRLLFRVPAGASITHTVEWDRKASAAAVRDARRRGRSPPAPTWWRRSLRASEGAQASFRLDEGLRRVRPRTRGAEPSRAAVPGATGQYHDARRTAPGSTTPPAATDPRARCGPAPRRRRPPSAGRRRSPRAASAARRSAPPAAR